MPSSVVSISGQRPGEYVLLEAALPQQPVRNVGVLLLDPATDRGWLKMREDYNTIAADEDAEVFTALEEDLRAQIAENGAEAFLQSLEDSLSNVLRITGRQEIQVDSFTRVLSRLFSDHVETVDVHRFRTHVPLYTLRAAAGRLGEEMPVDAEDWIPAPQGMKLTSDLFAAHVVGRSMEPRIPDGSLNLFRYNPAGSRQGKIVLVERYGATGETARYTVKRYTSQKRESGGQWEHTRIRLEPLNPEFEAWDVDPQDFAVVAEWLRVIE
jgi:phage repressor protein C with HTH and peptisase S24 domain